jgi:hypothetical protein
VATSRTRRAQLDALDGDLLHVAADPMDRARAGEDHRPRRAGRSGLDSGSTR